MRLRVRFTVIVSFQHIILHIGIHCAPSGFIADGGLRLWGYAQLRYLDTSKESFLASDIRMS